MERNVPITVLVVDDEPLIRMVGADILEADGYRVLEAANAEEALRHLEKGAEVVVLFTDINMPGLPDGLGLAHLVHERWPEVRILVASGAVKPGPGELPGDGLFLSKPYRAEDLLGLMQDLMRPERKALS